MLNFQLDCHPTFSPQQCRSMAFFQLSMICRYGSTSQKQSILDWAYSGCSAEKFYELYFLATGSKHEHDI